MICADIWGGKNGMEHVARYMLPIDDAMTLARTELNGGFLVNLRTEPTWGEEQNFATRLSSVCATPPPENDDGND